MALTFVNKGSTSCESAVTACSVTYTPTNGNLLVVIATDNGTATTRSASDNGTSTYANEYSTACSTPGGGFGCLQSRTCNVSGSPTTITANWSPADTGAVIVLEYSGEATSTCSDTGSPGTSASGTGATETAGNLVSANANDVIVGHAFVDGTTNTYTASGAWNLRAQQSSSSAGINMAGVDQIVAATSTYNAAVQVASCTTCTWWASSGAFKAAVGGGPTTDQFSPNWYDMHQVHPGFQTVYFLDQFDSENPRVIILPAPAWDTDADQQRAHPPIPANEIDYEDRMLKIMLAPFISTDIQSFSDDDN